MSESSEDSAPPIDPEDPMYEYLVAKRKEEKALKKPKKGKSKSKGKHKDETPEERRARKERKKLRKAMGKSEVMRGVEELLNSLDGRAGNGADRQYGSRSPLRGLRSRSRSPRRARDGDDRRPRNTPERRRSGSRTRSPVREGRSFHGRDSRSRSPGFRTYDDRRGTRRYDDVNEARGHGHERAPPSRRRDHD